MLGKADPGLAHRLADQLVQPFEMGARRDLRHHAAIGAVILQLGRHQVGQDAAILRHQGGGGLVAA